MRELKICRRHTIHKDVWVPLENRPHSNPPSIEEILEALKEAKEWNWLDDDYPVDIEKKIDNLIKRLENA